MDFSLNLLSTPTLAYLTVDDLFFILRGFGVVMVILAGLWILTEITGQFFVRYEKRKATGKKTKVAKAAFLKRKSEKQVEEDAPYIQAAVTAYMAQDAKLAAIITAAAYEVLGPVEVISIRGIDPRSGWAAEGRRQHFGSHRLR